MKDYSPSTHKEPVCRPSNPYLTHGIILAAYALLALLVTWPAVTTAASHLAGDRGDGWQNLFNLWWMRQAIATCSNPYHTPYMFAPEGVTLLFHTFSPFNAVIGAAFSLIMDWIPAYNLLALMHYALGGYTMFLLAHHLTGDRAAAFVAGLLFTFSPYHIGHGVGHLQLMAIEMVPPALLFMLRTLKDPEKRNPLLAGLFVVLAAMCSWYYLIYLFLFAVSLGLGRFLSMGRKAFDRMLLKRLAILALVIGMFLGPLLTVMVVKKVTAPTVRGHTGTVWSADLVNLFIPGARSAWSGFLGNPHRQWTGNKAENTAYLGYLLSIMALVGLVKARSLPHRTTWGATAAFFILMSLGPYLHINGSIYDQVPLPYAWLDAIVPVVFSFTGVPVRMSFGTNLCMCLLAAGGLAWLRTISFSARAGKRRGLIFILAFGAAAMAELWPGPHITTRLHVPEFFLKIAHEPPTYTILDMRNNSEQVYGIVRHRKPLINGHTSRDPLAARKALEEMPVFRAMRRSPEHGTDCLQGGTEKALSDLRARRVRYIVRRKNHNTFVEDGILKLEKVFKDKKVCIYIVPQDAN